MVRTSSDNTEGQQIWHQLFHDTSFLELCLEKKIYFTLIGEITEHPRSSQGQYLALIVTNDGTSKFSRDAWTYFKNSLQTPNEYRENEFEIKFSNCNIILNVYNLMYARIHRGVIVADPDRLVDEYLKSGTIPVRAISASTFQEPQKGTDCAYPGPISPRSCGRGYTVELLIVGQKRIFQLVSSVIELWDA
ncbi:hypothetical protein F5Y08DRAFT_332299 [Xylaria arbuscula]|nr:hypothetical protein F5Y08DRAFT_332299 [Xylaria arbuscula]